MPFKCFLCVEEVKYEEIQPNEFLSKESAYVLSHILEVPLECISTRSKFKQAPYCQICVRKIKEIQKILEELAALEKLVLKRKNEVETQLRESWEKIRQTKTSNSDLDSEVDQFRDEIVTELNASKLLTTLTKVRENRSGKKFYNKESNEMKNTSVSLSVSDESPQTKNIYDGLSEGQPNSSQNRSTNLEILSRKDCDFNLSNIEFGPQKFLQKSKIKDETRIFSENLKSIDRLSASTPNPLFTFSNDVDMNSGSGYGENSDPDFEEKFDPLSENDNIELPTPITFQKPYSLLNESKIFIEESERVSLSTEQIPVFSYDQNKKKKIHHNNTNTKLTFNLGHNETESSTRSPSPEIPPNFDNMFLKCASGKGKCILCPGPSRMRIQSRTQCYKCNGYICRQHQRKSKTYCLKCFNVPLPNPTSKSPPLT